MVSFDVESVQGVFEEEYINVGNFQKQFTEDEH